VFKVLDLFCGGGGAAMGIHRALLKRKIKHEIHGYDNRLMPDYPFIFHKGDALEVDVDEYDFVWASPPCQAYSFATIDHRQNLGYKYPELILPTRKLIAKKSYVIENVPNTPLHKSLELCGCMFDLKVYRKRWFETNFVVYQPKHKKHDKKVGEGMYTVISGGGWRYQNEESREIQKWSDAMGIDWIEVPNRKYRLPSGHPLAEAIPPAYSQFIMNQFLSKYRPIESWM
jgi:DNA (cytosine-5)-methyltransferase 1